MRDSPPACAVMTSSRAGTGGRIVCVTPAGKRLKRNHRKSPSRPFTNPGVDPKGLMICEVVGPDLTPTLRSSPSPLLQLKRIDVFSQECARDRMQQPTNVTCHLFRPLLTQESHLQANIV